MLVIYFNVCFAGVCSEASDKWQVKEQIEKLQDTFLELKDELVKDKDIDTFKIRLISMNVDGVEHHVQFLQEIAENNDTIMEIWMNLSHYMNFLNYEILEHILKMFKNKYLKGKMDEYSKKMKRFFKATRLCTFLNYWPVRGKTPFKEELHHFLTVKTTKNWNTCTLEELDNTRESLARKLLIPNFALIQEANEGCVSITFSIPPSLVARLQDVIKNTEPKAFVDMDIETITVDGVVCYEAPLLQYTTHSKQSCHITTEIIPDVCSNHNIEELLHIGKFACSNST